MERWAHSLNVAGERHRLVDHLRGTADLARRFGTEFGAGDFSYAAGLLHDTGKILPDWQDYLLAREAGLRVRRVPHKTSGAMMFMPIAQHPGRLVIQGHHGGIPNVTPLPDDCDEIRDTAAAAALTDLMPEISHLMNGPSVVPSEWLTWTRSDIHSFEMAVRLAHSTLVDADFLDTSAHFNATEPHVRPRTDFAHLNERFTHELGDLLAHRTPSPVDGIRASLLDECLAAAQGPRGTYRLPAPTGSGKTISAAAFALAHAARHGMSRVVVAVPFLSITEQNAAVYRRLLGDEHVIEHHSGLAPSEGDGSHTRAKYGVENWDSPFVITTTVQLFESLFSNRPSKTRKLHRLANAVIILDEIQAIPNHVLPVILDGLRILQQRFGATIVLSSATQPTWDLLAPWRGAALEVRDIVADPPKLYAGLRRSTIDWAEHATLDAVADALAAEDQVMMVVNTTGNARDLARLVRDREADGVLHLSTRMHPAHRRAVLADVRRRLDAALPVRLVTTQLVEAGVDLDFPVVMRAMAPAENLSQARGRCNREGRRPSGRFVVINCPDLKELESYRTGALRARQHFKERRADLDDPRVMREYFKDVYETLGIDEFQHAQRIQDERRMFRYADVARLFKMIEDEATPVVVGSAPEAAAVLEDLLASMEHNGAPPPERFRRLQDYTVSLPTNVAQQAAGSLREEIPGVSVWRGPYDPLTGVTIESDSPQDSVW